MPSTYCINCNRQIDVNSKPCPFCGQQNPVQIIPVPAPELSTWNKIKIYLASFFLAPFGLFWFFKHFRSENPANKRVAYYCLLITIVTLAVVTLLTSYALDLLLGYIDAESAKLYEGEFYY